MNKAFRLLSAAALAGSAPSVAQEHPPIGQPLGLALGQLAQKPDSCTSSDPHEVVVCGRSQQRYRIDPDVYAATRAAETPPPKPALDASRDTSCTGANCGGGTIPLVGMALTVLKAVELAAQGEDWRQAFRTRPDQYQVYEAARARQAARSHITVGVSARDK